MGSYLPDKPVLIEVIEGEREVPYTAIRYVTGAITLLVIFFCIYITLLVTAIGYIYGSSSVGYFFIPVMIAFVFSDPVFKVLILIELAIFFVSIAIIVLNRNEGLLADLKGDGNEMFTFSELFVLGVSLSFIIVLLFGSAEDTGVPDLYHLHVVVLDAPFFEEITFRFIWLIIPSFIISLHLNGKTHGMNENKESRRGVLYDFLRYTLKGKGTLSAYDYVLVIVSAIFFGLMHFVIPVLDLSTFQIRIEFSWGAWKIIQATTIGIILGYLALKGGLPFSLVFHWLVNSLAIAGVLSLFLERLSFLLYITVGLYIMIVVLGFVVIGFAIARLSSM